MVSCADAPFERTIDVGIEFFGGKPRTFVEREMQPKRAPRRVRETIELCWGRWPPAVARVRSGSRMSDVRQSVEATNCLPQARCVASINSIPVARPFSITMRLTLICGWKEPPAAMKDFHPIRARVERATTHN